MSEQYNSNYYNQRNNTGLLNLLLAYFFPIYLSGGKAEINTTMVSIYASRYMLRNSIATLLTFVSGELLLQEGQVILGEAFTGLFVIFAGLCSVYLVALVDAKRKVD